ncbi:dicarboxylate/amino acid:cation symporter [Rugamonas apoptosis]|uniref:Dicarboxylate/amino acid:cation symporter n=1 Tax=Rugamonas apoptosis TaxID=2758570 RepID=A0A7W2IN55_9BURK|nr:dicarboxylate/amino acid:cation symporter [Rugamonas apoptosis]MBA5690182.1 dicarboxylate/amino acid:cation symporter [Rugamonas apoptosis]
MNKQSRLTTYILVGLVLGIFAGYLANLNLADPAGFADMMSLVTTLFLRLIKMIIAPLVFSTLVVGIARMGDASEVGRIGIKTLGWFFIASLISLTLGLILVNMFRPGDALLGHLPATTAASGIVTSGLSLKEFVTHLVPASIIEGMSKNEILQIVIFSLFFGSAAAAVGEKSAPMVDAMDGVAHVMLKVTGYVMKFAPFAVFAAVAGVIGKSGLGVLKTYGVFMSEFYFGIAVLWALLIGIGFAFLGKRIGGLMAEMRGPALLAFSTASSEAAYPKTLEGLERFGVRNRIAAFVLPIGYSFNLDGSMMYCTFATVFIAQAYGIEMTLGQQMTMMMVLMLTSKGMAGVPRASLVVIAATLGQFNIPEAGLVLLLGIDHFLDMARSATNVIGNSIATAVVAKWEGELVDPIHRDLADAPLP